jgi:hypothetical protein
VSKTTKRLTTPRIELPEYEAGAQRPIKFDATTFEKYAAFN